MQPAIKTMSSFAKPKTRSEQGDQGHELNLDSDLPIVVPSLPATARQRRVALIVVAVLTIASALVAPVAQIQVGRIDAFVPVLQTVMAAADLLTATLLSAQYRIQPDRALLAVIAGYIFSGAMAFLQTLSFPGGYAPGGVIGDGYNTPAWFFVLWHTMFPLSILAYSLLKDMPSSSIPGEKSGAALAMTLAAVFLAICALTWIVTSKVTDLPSFYTGSVTLQTRFGNQINVALWSLGALTLSVLFLRRRTILDLWLMLTLFAWMPNFLVAAVASSVRFSLGWYAARGFALIASCTLLCVLLAETSMLYSVLANAMAMQKRERRNRLMSIDAATAAIGHEIKSPLGSIVLNVSSALEQLHTDEPDVSELQQTLAEIEDAALRIDATISSVRDVFKGNAGEPSAFYLEDVARQVVRLLQYELRLNSIVVREQFASEPRRVRADPRQMQQVILNLMKNAIEVLRDTAGPRWIDLSTRLQGAFVALRVRDSGPGIADEVRPRIFEAFFTTKAEGTGLGLAVCRAITEKQGGKLKLISAGPHGTTFQLELPAGE